MYPEIQARRHSSSHEMSSMEVDNQTLVASSDLRLKGATTVAMFNASGKESSPCGLQSIKLFGIFPNELPRSSL